MLFELYITTKCNFTCAGCSAGTSCHPEHFPLEQIKREIDALAEIVGDGDDFGLLGGEPCLHPDFLEIVAYAAKIRAEPPHKYIWSNGTILPLLRNEAAVAVLREAGFTHIGLTAYPKKRNPIDACVARCGEIGFTHYVNTDLRRFHLFDVNPLEKHLAFPSENKTAAEVFSRCHRQRICHCVSHGRLFRCPSMRALYHAAENGWTHNTGDLLRENDAWFSFENADLFREAVKQPGECCRLCPIFDGPGLHALRPMEEQGLATAANTSFLSVGAYPDREKMASLVASARKNDIFLTIADYQRPWENFYVNKVLARQEHLEAEKAKGKRWVILVDSRDVIFLAGRQEILRKYNEIKDIGRALFVAEYNGDTWPLMEPWFSEIVHRANGGAAALNSGLIAGHVDLLLEINRKAIQLHDEMASRDFRHRICEIVFEKAGEKRMDELITDDQFLYQLVMLLWPQKFQLDTERRFFANAYMSKPFDLTRSDQSPGEARIIQSSGARFQGGFVARQGMVPTPAPYDRHRHQLSNPMPCIHGDIKSHLAIPGKRCRGFAVSCTHPELIPSADRPFSTMTAHCATCQLKEQSFLQVEPFPAK